MPGAEAAEGLAGWLAPSERDWESMTHPFAKTRADTPKKGETNCFNKRIQNDFLLISDDETEDPKQANVASGHTTGAEGAFSDEEGAVSEVNRYMTALPRISVGAACALLRNICPAHQNTGEGERRQRIEMLNTTRRRNVRVSVWSGWFKTTCAVPSTGTMLTSDFILPLCGVLRGVV